MSGHRLGRAIRDTVADTVIHVRTGLLRHESAERARATTALMDHLETQMRDMVGPLADDILAQPGLPESVEKLLGQLKNPEYGASLLVQLLVTLGGVITILPAAGAAVAQDVKNAVMAYAKNVPADIGALVQGAATHKIPPQVAAQRATVWGYDQTEFDMMVSAAKQMISSSDAMELFKRGKMAWSDVEGYAQLEGIDPVHFHKMRELLWRKPDVGIATEARVRGFIDAGTHMDWLAEHGIDPTTADIVYRTAGQPPGIQELIHLWNRGEITQETVEQALLESHYNNKYIPAILQFRRYLPPPRSIVPMMRSGAITVERGRHLLQEHGLSAEDAEAFVQEATMSKTANAKHATAQLILSMYTDLEMDRATAERLLRNLHHDEESMVLELGHAEALRGKKLRDAAVSRIRAEYDKRHLDRATASAQLDRAAVPSQARDQMLATWDVERDVGAPQLTVAQLTQGFKKGGLDAGQLRARLEGLGYNADDVAVLMAIAGAA